MICFYFFLKFFTALGFASDGLTLQDRWIEEVRKPMVAVYPSTLKTIENRHFLLVGGIMNELSYFPYVSKYFGESIEVIQKEFHTSVSYFGPSSRVPIPDNAESIYRVVLDTFQKYGKPLIIVGHSKGGAEILYFALKHWELLVGENPVIEKLVVVQGAIGGSPLADVRADSLMYPLSIPIAAGLNSLKAQNGFMNFSEVFSEMEEGISRKLSAGVNQGQLTSLGQGSVTSRLDPNLDIRSQVAQKIFYVRGEQSNPHALSPGISLVLFLSRNRLQGQNDGLLKVEDQFLLPDGVHPFGTDLGVLPNTDHLNLVLRGYFSGSQARSKEAFTRALIQQIHED